MKTEITAIYLLGWPKSVFGFFHLNTLFGPTKKSGLMGWVQKTLILGKIEDRRRGRRQRIRWLDGHQFQQAQGDSEGWGSLLLQSMGSQRVGLDLATEHHHHKSRDVEHCWLLPETRRESGSRFSHNL